MRDREKRRAETLGFLDRLQVLEKDLLQVEHITDVHFDIDEFFSDIPHVCVVYRYAVPMAHENYFQARRDMLHKSLEIMERHGLTRTSDTIEDHGEHYYIVCKANWKYRNPYTEATPPQHFTSEVF